LILTRPCFRPEKAAALNGRDEVVVAAEAARTLWLLQWLKKNRIPNTTKIKKQSLDGLLFFCLSRSDASASQLDELNSSSGELIPVYLAPFTGVLPNLSIAKSDIWIRYNIFAAIYLRL
jgi:hypothetical protein